MSRIVVIILGALLVVSGVFLFTQLDALRRVVEPNQRKELAVKRELVALLIEALRTGKTDALTPAAATDAEVAGLIEKHGAAMGEAIERARTSPSRLGLAESVAALRNTTDPDLVWEHVRFDDRDEPQLVFLAPKGAQLGMLIVRVRCGRSVHDLRLTRCARVPRGWITFGDLQYAQAVRRAGCESQEPAPEPKGPRPLQK